MCRLESTVRIVGHHVDQLQAAFARLVALNGFSPEGAAQEMADMALFMDQFLASQPFDLIARLQARQTAA